MVGRFFKAAVAFFILSIFAIGSAGAENSWFGGIWKSGSDEKKTQVASKTNTKKAAEPEKNTGPAWSLNCSVLKDKKTKSCNVSQSLYILKTKQRLLTVSIRKIAKQQKHTILISLPHGLFLPAGTTLQIDKNKAIRIPVQTADANGSYAGGLLQQDFLNLMNKGKSLKVSFFNSNRKAITVPVALKGFSSAFKKMSKTK